jgi:acyl carrier protein
MGLLGYDAMKTARQQICGLAAQALDLPAAQIRPEAPWEEYGGDSLAVVEMILSVQEHFRITLQAADLNQLKCLDDLVRVVERKIREDPDHAVKR